MSNVDLARWQFAITTVYHFLFVPITIGLSAIVAYYHTRYVRHKRPDDMRLTKFFGKLFLINFAMGIVTGIV
ncbi:MAG: cytochrome ubiquinol oxidase subunit I, partial [Intrasporangiaceae bacterium]|nr:cytochrome ubiquinol oxidase subunit I [Intrasporangiaceae bacterium]